MTASLTAAQARRVRMASLLLAGQVGTERPGTVAAVVEWFGAMQAQDLGSGLWSLGSRLPGMAVGDVHDALERREALRTWPMRGTVHFVPPRDARWMLEVMGVRALAGAAARRDFLGLSEDVANRAVDVLGGALAGGGRLTRAECVAALTEAGVVADGQLAYHLLWYASQQGVTCMGPQRGKEQTFVLLDDWAPEAHRPDRDEALATMARRFARSHGPATAQDLAGWLGVTMGDTRRGLAGAGDVLVTVDVEGRPMVADAAVLDAALPSSGEEQGVLALAGFDEYLLGFKERSLMLDPEHKQAIIPGGNGVFQWTVVRDGRVVATWRRKVTRTKVVVDVLPLAGVPQPDPALVEQAVAPYADFVGLPVEVRHPQPA